MPFIFRKIRQSRWYSEYKEFQWLEEEDIPADPFADLNTSGNRLSVYYIEDRDHLSRVATALAATTNSPSNLDYALIDYEILLALGFKFDHSSGDTPDATVNQWHRDIVELSGNKLRHLASSLLEQAERMRIPERVIRDSLIVGVRAGQLISEKMNPSMAKALGI